MFTPEDNFTPMKAPTVYDETLFHTSFLVDIPDILKSYDQTLILLRVGDDRLKEVIVNDGLHKFSDDHLRIRYVSLEHMYTKIDDWLNNHTSALEGYLGDFSTIVIDRTGFDLDRIFVLNKLCNILLRSGISTYIIADDFDDRWTTTHYKLCTNDRGQFENFIKHLKEKVK